MYSRRKFLLNGSLTTGIMLALQPLETLAKITSPFTDISSSYKLLILHTSNLDNSINKGVIDTFSQVNHNLFCLHAGKQTPETCGQLTYDVSPSVNGLPSSIDGDFKIIQKGKVRIGVVNALPEENQVIENMDRLSTYLKKEKKCHIVLCLSQLGYKNNNLPDDLSLAKNTTHLDFIIGGHDKNYYAHPVIALNKADNEVVIKSSSESALGLGVINIDFDAKGQKKSISFTA